MAGKGETTRAFLDYVDSFGPVMHSRESVTSHVFCSLLTALHGIPATDLLPQGGTTKGQIDYVYMPPRSTDTHVFIELKKYGSLRENNVNKMKKYLKHSFPKELNRHGREDSWRVLIITDLLKVFVFFRRKKKPATHAYGFQLKFDSPLKATAGIANILKMKRGQLARQILWEEGSNRRDIILRELKGKWKTDLYSTAYGGWTQRVGKGKGWPAKFIKAFRVASGENVSLVVPSDHKILLIAMFEESKVRKAVRALFKSPYGVAFRRNAHCSAFKPS